MKHMKKQGKGSIQVLRGAVPKNKINNPALLPMIYPTLFPYGLGRTGDCTRANMLSLERHVKHLFNLADSRLFLFVHCVQPDPA